MYLKSARLNALRNGLKYLKKRRSINFGKVCEEARHVDRNLTESWINTLWMSIKEQHDNDNILIETEAVCFF